MSLLCWLMGHRWKTTGTCGIGAKGRLVPFQMTEVHARCLRCGESESGPASRTEENDEPTVKVENGGL